MADKILHKRSYTPGSKPTTSNLDALGEIAINVDDGKAFLRKSGSGIDTIEEFIVTNATNTGSITLSGSLNLTGSFLVTGSTTQIGNNDLLGNTTLSGSIIISGALGTNDPTVKIYGDTQHNGYIRFDPVSTNIDTSISASYIYVSGSTNDLYFSQNGNGYNNVTRLRWLEGNLYTGLLNGGLITITPGSTTFNLGSGSGIVVNLNASLNDNPYPTITYVNWGNFTNQSLTYLTTDIQTYIAIDANSQIVQHNTPLVDGEFNTQILIGTVLHQNKTTVNASITYPSVAYGYKQRTYDFIKAFGPLKLSGLTIIPSSSLELNVGSGTAFADGRNYQVDPNNPSYITDPGTTVSKIFRYYQSGSSFVQDTNGGLGYTVIDPANYNPDGTGVLTAVPGTGTNRRWSIQRVFWYPNSATKGIVVYYGSATYASEIDAAANISYEQFQEVENTKQNAVYLGAIVIRNDGDFTNSTSYRILPGGVFRNVGGSGGGGNISSLLLSQLGDVAISGPTDGQPLIYVNSATKWENKSFISASISGNAATATTSATASSADSFLIRNGATITGSINVTGSVNAASITSSFTGSLTGSLFGTASWALSASQALTASSADSFLIRNGATISGSINQSGSFTINGTLTATTLVVQTITASVEFLTGSTKFGDALDDTHQFTGSVGISGSLTVVGPTIASGSFTGSFLGNYSGSYTGSYTGSLTGSLFGTASWAVSASQAVTASYIASTGTNAFVQNGNSFGAAAVLGTNDAQNLQFEANNAIRVTISGSNGNVGINTTTPLSTLDVNGLIIGGTSSSVDGAAILVGKYSPNLGHLTTFGSNQSSGGPVIGYNVYPSSSFNHFISSITSSVFIARSAFAVDSTFRWYTGIIQAVNIGASASLSQKMILDNDGNLGIGVASPSVRLHVSGNILITGSVNITSSLNVIGPITASIFSGSAFSGSFFGTASWALSASRAITASYADNANLLDGLDSTVFVLTSSFSTYTASINAFSASILTHTSSINAFSASILTHTSSINAFSASILSYTTSINLFSASIKSYTASLNAFSASILTHTSSINAFSASILSYTSSLNAKTSSFATTGSNTFIGNQTINGTVSASSFTGSYTGSLTGSLLGTASWAASASQAVTASYIASTGTNAFVQGGNSFGTAAILGTNNNIPLNIETGGNTRLFISESKQIQSASYDIQYLGFTTSSGTSITLPSGLKQYDLVVVTSYLNNTASIIPQPSGSAGNGAFDDINRPYTLGQSGSANSVKSMWSYRVLGSSLDTSIVNITGSTIAFAFRNVDTTNPIHVIAASASAATGFPNPPSITTTNSGSVVIAIGYLDDDQINRTNITASVGYTLIGSTSGSNNNGTIMAEYLVKTTPGVEDPGIFRTGSGAPDDSWVANTFALNRYTSSAFSIGGDVQSIGGLLATHPTSVNSSQRYPIGHHSAGETVFEIDPTWTETQLQSYFNSPNVTWATSGSYTGLNDAPGGYAIKISGSTDFGFHANSGFPLIPVDTSSNDWYYMECWIRNEAGQNARHYFGSVDLNENFKPIQGIIGSYTYNVSNYDPGTSWTKVYGYWNGYGTTNFVTNGTVNWSPGTKYFTPLGLLNYLSPGSSSYISGWKVIKVSHSGTRYFQDNVGIGGITPSTRLNVKEANTGTEGFIVTNWNGVNTSKIGSDTVTGGGKLSLLTNGSVNNVFISSYTGSYFNGGNVGIGTASPSTGKLQINTGTANNNALTIQADTVTSRTYGIGITNGADLNFYDNFAAASRLFISASGNVGIGITTPFHKLHIAGTSATSTITSSNDFSGIRIDGSTSATERTGIAYQAGGGGSAAVVFGRGGSFDTNISFYTNPITKLTGSQMTERVVIDSIGNVGIGTPNPSTRLHLYDAASSPAFTVQDGGTTAFTRSNSGSIIFTGVVNPGSNNSAETKYGIIMRPGALTAETTFAIRDLKNSADRITILQDGNVGIGIASPSARLHVTSSTGTVFKVDGSGSLNTDAINVSSSGRVTIDDAYRFEGGTLDFGSGYANGRITWNTGEASYYSQGTNNLRLGTTTYTSAIFVTASNGNVGINNTNPTAQLHVVGNISASAFTGSLISFTTSGSIRANNISTYSPLLISGSKTSYGGIYDQYSAVNGMMYDSAGNGGVFKEGLAWYWYYNTSTNCLAIGDATTNSNYQLYLNSKGLFSSGSSAIGDLGGTAPSARLHVSSSTGVVFKADGAGTQGVNALHVSSSGNVGVGIVPRLYKLEVYNSGSNAQGREDRHIAAIGTAPSINMLSSESTPRHVGTVGVATTTDNYFTGTSGGELCIISRGTVSGSILFGHGGTINASLSTVGTLTVRGDVIAYGTPSDISYKTNITPISNSLDKIMSLEPVSFTWKEDTETSKLTDIKDDIGFIAQQVQEVLPELVRQNKDDKLSIRERAIIPLLVGAIKEQQKQIDELKYLLQNKQ
jgi:hypothetical protein